ncbi:MAG: hypothetical protein Q9199_008006 [Rusavskia elegans]
MIIPGRSAIPTLLTNLRSAKTQTQPCGIDLTLKHVSKWTSPGIIDFSNALRLPASSTKIPFLKHHQQSQTVSSILAKTHPSKDAKAALEKHMRAPQEDSVFLDPGSYLV